MIVRSEIWSLERKLVVEAFSVTCSRSGLIFVS